jgi:hypothetical protein
MAASTGRGFRFLLAGTPFLSQPATSGFLTGFLIVWVSKTPVLPVV